MLYTFRVLPKYPHQKSNKISMFNGKEAEHEYRNLLLYHIEL